MLGRFLMTHKGDSSLAPSWHGKRRKCAREAGRVLARLGAAGAGKSRRPLARHHPWSGDESVLVVVSPQLAEAISARAPEVRRIRRAGRHPNCRRLGAVGNHFAPQHCGMGILTPRQSRQRVCRDERHRSEKPESNRSSDGQYRGGPDVPRIGIRGVVFRSRSPALDHPDITAPGVVFRFQFPAVPCPCVGRACIKFRPDIAAVKYPDAGTCGIVSGFEFSPVTDPSRNFPAVPSEFWHLNSPFLTNLGPFTFNVQRNRPAVSKGYSQAVSEIRMNCPAFSAASPLSRRGRHLDLFEV